MSVMGQTVRPTEDRRIAGIVEDARAFSFEDPERIHAWARLFVVAHRAAPGGLSIEIGTWKGGSAVVWLGLLEELYHARHRPMLFTIDPYGDKPYNGGDQSTDAPKVALYGGAEYVAMKTLLAAYPNHAHFALTSDEFVTRLLGRSYWWQGRFQEISNLTFVLIDGEHDAASIEREARALAAVLRPRGVIIVDNVDNDPKTEPMLLTLGLHRRIVPAKFNQRWAVLQHFRVDQDRIVSEGRLS